MVATVAPASAQSSAAGFRRSPRLVAGNSRNASTMMQVRWSDRCFSASSGPVPAV